MYTGKVMHILYGAYVIGILIVFLAYGFLLTAVAEVVMLIIGQTLLLFYLQ